MSKAKVKVSICCGENSNNFLELSKWRKFSKKGKKSLLTAQTFQKKSMDRSEEFNYSRRVVIAELGGNSDVETNEKPS